MKIGVLKIEMYISWSKSLKDKRSEVNRIISKVQNKFKVTIAQVDALDKLQSIVLGVALISNDVSHLDQMMDKVLNFIEEIISGEIITIEREIMKG